MTTKDTGIYQSLFTGNRKLFILLIDPEKHTAASLEETVIEARAAAVDIILVGGSLISNPFDETIRIIKNLTSIPVLLFPGNLLQVCPKADGILLLSLISGRNPEYLIGNHVLASQYIKKSGIEVIPTGYILVGDYSHTSVEYISNTRPIPSEKADIIEATALAGEQLGLKLIYLEAGSGASGMIHADVLSRVAANVSLPVIAGGGIKNPSDIRLAYEAGAHAVVVGTAVENDLTVLHKLAEARNEFNGKI